MIKYLYHLLIGIIVIVFVSTVYFLYSNFYLTLANAKEVKQLVGRVSVVPLDIKRFQNVVEKLKEKEVIKPLSTISDPFYLDRSK